MVKYNVQWRHKKLKDISNILSFLSDSDIKKVDEDDSISGFINTSLEIFVICSEMTDGFYFIGEILPPNRKKFDGEALLVKKNAFDTMPSWSKIETKENDRGNPQITMFIPYNRSDNLLQLCDPITVFIGRLFTLSRFMHDYGILDKKQ